MRYQWYKLLFIMTMEGSVRGSYTDYHFQLVNDFHLPEWTGSPFYAQLGVIFSLDKGRECQFRKFTEAIGGRLCS